MIGKESPPLDGDRTLRDSEPSDAREDIPEDRLRISEAPSGRAFDERYVLERSIGEGGMGALVLFKDMHIGRRIALKVIHTALRDSKLARSRFLREARLQGRLEHPAVVPVYDMGTDPEGREYFTMKHVRGVTLEQIVQQLRKGYSPTYSRRRLLTALSNVCLAVDFAHRRGVLHRDLKPANIMLGAYGEVYVLDWGLATVMGAGDEAHLDEDEETLIANLPGGKTVPGSLLGTPGYASPEQLRGERNELGPGTDTYALGAILFELLTLEDMHPRESFAGVRTSTLEGKVDRPSERAPDLDVPPELDAIVLRATALEPVDRYPSARAMHEAIEAFLDGERDEERRKSQAAQHAAAAAAASERSRTVPGQGIEARREAMREVGRALALDPSNADALATMVTLMTRPPSQTPPEVQAELARRREGHLRWLAGVSVAAYGSMFLYLPLLLWSGVRDWSALILLYGVMLACIALSLRTAFGRRASVGSVLAVMVASNIGLACTATFFGPLVGTPMFLAVNVTGYALNLAGRARILSIATACATLLSVIALGAAGALPGSYSFTGGVMAIQPGAIALPALPTWIFLGAASLGAVLTGTFVVKRVRDTLDEAEERLYVYAWHLRELVPDSARASGREPTAPLP